MCVRSCGLKAQKGEAEVSLLLFYWQPSDDVLSYSTEKRVRHSDRNLLPQRV
jgi:hypothetical protein